MNDKQYMQFRNGVEKDITPFAHRENSVRSSLNGRFVHINNDNFEWSQLHGNEEMFQFPAVQQSWRVCIFKRRSILGGAPGAYTFEVDFDNPAYTLIVGGFLEDEDADIIAGLVVAAINVDGTLGPAGITASFVNPEGTDYSTTNSDEEAYFTIYGNANGTQFQLSNFLSGVFNQPSYSGDEWFSGATATGQKVLGGVSIGTDLILFTTNGLAGNSTGIIWKASFDQKDFDTLEVVYSKDLGFNLEYQIEATARFSVNNYRIVYWTDNLNIPRTINLDIPEIGTKSESFLNLTPVAESTKIELGSVNDGGGQITTGSYQFTAQYIDEFGNGTSYFPITNPISIFDEDEGATFTERDGAESNTLTQKSITIYVDNPDLDYEKIRFIVIKNTNGTTTASVFSEELIGTGTNVRVTSTYTNFEIQTDVSLASIDIERSYIKTAKTLEAKDNRLFLGNLGFEEFIDYQATANNILAEPLLQDLDSNRFKNGLNTARYRGYKRGETYAFGIVFWFKNGGRSYVYHIPGNDEYDANRVYESSLGYPVGLNYPSGKIKHHLMPEMNDNDSGAGGPADYEIFRKAATDVMQVLGRKFKNIDISEDIAKRITGFSIVRGIRRGSDRTIFGQGLLWPMPYTANPAVSTNSKVSPTGYFGTTSAAHNGVGPNEYLNFYQLWNCPDHDFGLSDYAFQENDEMHIVAAYWGASNQYITGPAGPPPPPQVNFSGYGARLSGFPSVAENNALDYILGTGDLYNTKIIQDSVMLNHDVDEYWFEDDLLAASPRYLDMESRGNADYNGGGSGNSTRISRGRVVKLDSSTLDPNYILKTALGGTTYDLDQNQLLADNNGAADAGYPAAGKAVFKYVSEIRRPNTTLYDSVGDIQYISCGHYQSVDEGYTSPGGGVRRFEVDVFGGDTFINNYSFRRQLSWNTEEDPDEVEAGGNVSIQLYLECEMNTELRHGSYFPKIPLVPTAGNIQFNNEFYELHKNLLPNERFYNVEYSLENKIETYKAVPDQFIDNSQIPTAIIFSQVTNALDLYDAYRYYLADDIFILPSEHGQINKLAKVQDNMYCLQRSAFAKIPINPKAFVPQEDTDVIEVSSGQVISDQQYISTIYGTNHQWSVAVSDKALYWYDSNNDIIFRFAQDGLTPLSIVRFFDHFFKNAFIGKIYETDNPINYKGVNAIYDFQRNEVLFSFFDQVYNPVSMADEEHKYVTICYSETIKGFNDEYSFQPYKGFSHLNNLITFSNQDPYAAPKAWIHLPDSLRGSFYDTVYQSNFEYIINKIATEEKVFDVIRMNMESNNDGGGPYAKRFFDSGVFTTRDQVNNIDFNTYTKLARRGHKWRFPIGREDGGRGRMRDMYMFCKFIINNRDNLEVRVFSIDNQFRISRMR